MSERTSTPADFKPGSTTLGVRLLSAISRDPGAPDYPTTTANYTLANCLDFPRKTIPNFDQLMKDQLVLDYGCGPGWQAVAMHLQCRAMRVVGVDINRNWLSMGRALAEREACSEAVTFADAVPAELDKKFDIAISISSFEHFSDPVGILSQMAAAVRPNGRVIVTFAEPWLSHSGSHMDFFTRVPWVNLWFSEKTVMQVRSKFRSDGASRYEEIEGGLNRMTLAKFERIMKGSGLKVEHLHYYSTRRLPLVDKIPIIREFLVSSATCILRKP